MVSLGRLSWFNRSGRSKLSGRVDRVGPSCQVGTGWVSFSVGLSRVLRNGSFGSGEFSRSVGQVCWPVR